MEKPPAENAAPFISSLTAWEAKERAELLAMEPDEWREKRRVAENPDTTADVFEHFGHLLYTAGDSATNYAINHFAGLFAEAVAAHPNTPSPLLRSLLDYDVPLCLPAFCRNPILPFVGLEVPDFWLHFSDVRCEELLREEKLPSVGVGVFILRPESIIVQSARLHVVIAGEVQTCEEAKQAAIVSGFPEYEENRLNQFNKRYLQAFGLSYHLRAKGISERWTDRLFAALYLPLTAEPFHQDDDMWERSPMDLLNHLARDGNRLVRWAARTRLADPDFAFQF